MVREERWLVPPTRQRRPCIICKAHPGADASAHPTWEHPGYAAFLAARGANEGANLSISDFDGSKKWKSKSEGEKGGAVEKA